MKKSRKSKIVLLSVLGLATVSLATVGFASWVISGVTPATSNNITANVGQIEDKTLTASIDTENSDLSVRFDNLKQGDSSLKIANGSSTEQEDLQFSVIANISTTGTSLAGLLTSVKYEFTLDTFLSNAIKKNYITFDSNAKVASITVNESSLTTNTTGFTVTNTSATAIKITGTFSFGWGSAFNYDNPGKLVPSEKIAANGDKTNLEVLKEFVNSFPSDSSQNLLTITVTPNGTIK